MVVTGLAGSGKSTLSLALGAKTGLPVIHLDLHYWKPGWTDPTDAEWREKQREVLAGGSWIADGNCPRPSTSGSSSPTPSSSSTCRGGGAQGVRCGAASACRASYQRGATTRVFHRWRDEWQLAGRIWLHRRSDTEHERKTISHHQSRVAVHVLRSKREVSDFLDGVDAASIATPR